MIASGFTKRSISDQTGVFGYEINVNLDNQTGYCQVGFSGTQNFSFTFQNGRIYDPQNKFVQAYTSGALINIAGQVGPSTYDYSINGTPTALGNPISSGTYSWIYVNPSGTSPNVDIQVYGALPSYQICTGSAYQGSGTLITGSIVNENPNVKFRIFNVDIASTDSYSVSGFTTGDITGTGYFYLTSNDVSNYLVVLPITFYTNFGEVTVEYAISGYVPVYPNVYLTVSPTYSGNIVSVPEGANKKFTTYLSNYPNTAQVSVSLSYLSGTTGNIYQAVVASNSTSGLISGVVIGSQALTSSFSGAITGVDPTTSGIVSGTGIGILTSNIINATGQVSQNFSIEVTGMGTGTYNGSFLANAQVSGFVSGQVGVFGGMSLPSVISNVPGTGGSPFYLTGVIPLATGQQIIYPTGEFSLPVPLSYGTGSYLSGYIEAPQSFQGALSYNYSVVAVGYATGQTVTGIVESNFALEFEPGYYVFNKVFNGIVSGNYVTTQNFVPSSCIQSGGLSSGVFSGLFYWPQGANLSGSTGSNGSPLNCLNATGLPTISFSGVPNVLYDISGNIVPNNQVVLIIPPEGFVASENSNTVLSGNWTRTTTSRMGITPSGTGYFSQIIQNCLFTNGVWTESLASYYTGVVTNPLNTHINSIQSNIYLLNSGSANSATMSFSISGTNPKTLVFREISTTYPSGTYMNGSGLDNAPIDMGISLYQVISGSGQLIAENVNWQQGSQQSLQTLSQYSLSPVSSTDAAFAITLNPGNYYAEIYYETQTPNWNINSNSMGVIQFSQTSFNACKSWGSVPLFIVREGGNSGSISGYVSFSSQGSGMAISGVDFNATPIPFSLGQNQQSSLVNVPLYENSYCGGNAMFTAQLNASYVGFDSSAVGSQGTSNVLIFNDTCAGTGCPFTPPVLFPSFDYVILRYIWSGANGAGFDAKTTYAGQTIGYGYNTTVFSTSNPSNFLLEWCGNPAINTAGECDSIVNFNQILTDITVTGAVPVSIPVSVGGVWYTSIGDGNVQVSFEAYKGGTVYPAGFLYYNLSGTLVQSGSYNANCSLQDATSDALQNFAVLRFSPETQEIYITNV